MTRRPLLTFAALCLIALTGCSDTQTNTGGDVAVGVDAGGPAKACAPNQCTIAGACYDNGDPDPANACQACVLATDPTLWTPSDVNTCDDGNACTLEDTCSAGACAGTERVCDDGNGCTDDSCDAETGLCLATQNTAACDDGDACTEESICELGACQAGTKPTDCDDGNPCTTDACDSATGCTAAAIDGGTCDDGDTCTVNEVCVTGSCQGEVFMDCDDNSACTIDICDLDDGCSHESIAEQCSDDNLCTEDLCDPEKGCVYPFNTLPCDDGNSCTETDVCTLGACLGSALGLDDGNPCTTDTCDPEQGVLHEMNTDPCEDGDACSLGDTCDGSGVCKTGASALNCDDDNACTDDWCDGLSGCKNDPNTLLCDDDDACTEDDLCTSGACVGGAIDCDDGKPCTWDSCKADKGCVNAFEVTQSCRPNFNITFPTRGQTVQGSLNNMSVTVTGTVASEAGPILSVTLNGTPLTLQANGSFSHNMTVDVGGNVIRLEATDTMGTTRNQVQSFLWSSAYKKPTNKSIKNGIVNKAVGLWIGKDIIDDGTRNTADPSNLATLAEMVIQSFDVGDSIPSPAGEVLIYDVYITNLTHDPPVLFLNPMNGKLRLTGEIKNVEAQWSAVGTGPDPAGTVNISTILLQADIELTVTSHQLKAQVKNVLVTISENDIELSGDNWSGAVVSFIGSFFKGTLADQLSAEFETAVTDQVAPALKSALDSLVIEQSFDLPSLTMDGTTLPVDLVSDFQGVTTSTNGIEFRLRAAGYAASNTPHDGSTYKGVPNRMGCGLGSQSLSLPATYDLEASLADDVANSLLFAAWRRGLMEFVVPEEMLGDLALSEYGISDLVLTVSGMTAPTVTDCNAENALRLFVGDVGVNASLQFFGVPMSMQVWASFGADVNVESVPSCPLNGGAGCPENPTCEAIVCELDAFCCANAWDQYCDACASTGTGNAGLDCAEAVTACQSGVTLKVGDIAFVETEIQVEQDELIALESVLTDLIETQLVPAITIGLAGAAFTVALPEIDIGGMAPGIPEGTVLGINPQTKKRIGGNTIIQGGLK